MIIHESGWTDLKKTIEYIARGTICNTMESFENFVREGLQNGFPQLYRYIYKDYRGNIRINKNVFKHAEEGPVSAFYFKIGRAHGVWYLLRKYAGRNI